jgi:hypothetical protein|tara:strand:- start:1371 stop:1598 length:228 start_codon:yes stop_codon:yes gene_type:complete
MKELKATRIPPGDRWALTDDGEQIYPSLTECLNAIFMDSGMTEFYIDAQKGEVHTEDGKEKPPTIKKYSLYGEEY